jgi:hypothetical protein
MSIIKKLTLLIKQLHRVKISLLYCQLVRKMLRKEQSTVILPLYKDFLLFLPVGCETLFGTSLLHDSQQSTHSSSIFYKNNALFRPQVHKKDLSRVFRIKLQTRILQGCPDH